MTIWASREPLRRTKQNEKNRNKKEEDIRAWAAGLSPRHKGLLKELAKLKDVAANRRRLIEITDEITEVVRLDGLAKDAEDRQVRGRNSKEVYHTEERYNEDF